MGIETIAIIAGLAVAAGSTGYQVSQSLDAAREGRVENRKQQQAQGRLQTEAADKEKQTQMAQAQAAARARSRATAAYSSPATLPGTMTGGAPSSNGKPLTSLLGL